VQRRAHPCRDNAFGSFATEGVVVYTTSEPALIP
jgi:hypothetical protein